MRVVAAHRSLVEEAGSALRDAILSGELTPDTLYSVNQLATTLGVSRTPVREAVLGLAEAGLVRVERNRGFRVVRADAREIREIFDLRLLLEGPAAERAAAHAGPALTDQLERELAAMRRAARRGDEPTMAGHDRGFHGALLEAAGNHLLTATVNGLRDSIRTAGSSTAGRSRSLREIADEHAPLLDAVRRADAPGALSAMRAHLEHTRDLLLAQLL